MPNGLDGPLERLDHEGLAGTRDGARCEPRSRKPVEQTGAGSGSDASMSRMAAAERWMRRASAMKKAIGALLVATSHSAPSLLPTEVVVWAAQHYDPIFSCAIIYALNRPVS